MDLRLRCQQSDKDWSMRQKTRAEEIAAVAEAIGILSDDDAFDLFDETVNSFVQLKELKGKSVSRKAAMVLRGVAKKTNNLQLFALANKVQLDAFVKVKKAIDDMTAALTAEQADEVKHRDFCVDELNSNEVQTAKKNREIKELTTLIEESGNKIKTLEGEIAAAHAAIKEVEIQMKKAGETRELENKDYQTTITDQRATQAILQKALDRLASFYKKKALLQARQNPAAEPGVAAPPPPRPSSSPRTRANCTRAATSCSRISTRAG